MEDLIKSKQFKVLFIIFIVVSVFHILYATFTYRGLYLNGADTMVNMLNGISADSFNLFIKTITSKPLVAMAQSLPVAIAGLFHIKSKFVYIGLYSFAQIAFPFLLLIWNYFLTKRTGKINVFYWSLFTYGGLILPLLIYSCLEIHISVMMLFVLWNYLFSDMDFKKRDIIFIIFLVLSMFASYEYLPYIAFLTFVGAFFLYRKEEMSLNTRIGKNIIGCGSFIAVVISIIKFVNTGSNTEYFIREFIRDFIGFLPQLMSLNYCMVLIAVVCLFIFCIKNEELSKNNIVLLLCIFMYDFIYLAGNKYATVNPMWEGHLKTLFIAFVPVIFIWLFISDKYIKNHNNIRTQNFICIILMLCIFQTLWQIIDTSFWYKNIMYMKEELAKSDTPLYIPSEHEELISDFNEPNIRRYIWHWVFINTSILFADEYKPKTILMNYDEPINEGNLSFRERIYVPAYNQNVLNIPYDSFINQKNKFWDLTDIAKAIDKYNKEHNIKTDG